MRSKLLFISSIGIVLIALMASTVQIAAAVPISSGLCCLKETLNIQAQGERLFNLIKICEDNHFEFWKVEFDINCDSKSDMKNIKLTMILKQDKKSTSEWLKWEILKLKFQGDDICFTGWNGKGYSEETKYYYEIHGFGKGSYGGDESCRDALVEGKMLIVDHGNEPTPWTELTLRAKIWDFLH